MLIRQLAFVVFVATALLLGQTSPSPSSPANPNAQPAAIAPTQLSGHPPATRPSEDLAQMRVDLDRMDSLNMNMSSEIEFLHDQNLQILLRTNSQMWTILIRDLRQRLARDEQQQLPQPQAPGSGNLTPANPH
jgi:hypothetical protein